VVALEWKSPPFEFAVGGFTEGNPGAQAEAYATGVGGTQEHSEESLCHWARRRVGCVGGPPRKAGPTRAEPRATPEQP
jgi:hypothetical protein